MFGSESRFPKSLIEFQGRSASESACAEYLFERRWPQGFVCPGCSEGRAWLLKTKPFTYECAGCGRQTSVTAGTIMHASKLPLTIWFWAAFLMATHSNGISALQLQSQLGLGSYRTAWMLCAKLRRAMVNPGREPLSGVVEADETTIPFRTKNDPIVVPAGRGGVGKMLVAGAVEVDGGAPRRARLKVIDGFGKNQIHAFVLGRGPQHQAGDRRLALLQRHSRDQAQGDHPSADNLPHHWHRLWWTRRTHNIVSD
jgi:hypothetical protein